MREGNAMNRVNLYMLSILVMCVYLMKVQVASADDMLLFCGAGLRQPVQELVEVFQRDTGIRVSVEYGGSGKLLSRHIATGRGDLYLPGSFFYIEQLARKGGVVSSYDIVFHIPVVAVNRRRAELVKNFLDLAKPGVRVGLGDPRAMALGRTAEQILKNSGIRKKILPNVVVRAATVKQLTLYIVKGDVDAGIIARADALQNRDAVVALDVNPDWYKPEIVSVAVLKSSRQAETADKLAKFLSSERGVGVFEKYGFKSIHAK
jgi:molybdate transport system substrate-binding protein